jgi:hypothetical protein
MRKFFFPKLAWTLAVLMLAGMTLSVATMGAMAEVMVTVPRNVDVYDQPGGKGSPRGMLKRNSQVTLLQKRADHWCKVSGDAVPGGPGWIWCGIGDNNKDYSLKPAGGGGNVGQTGGGGGGQATTTTGPHDYNCVARGQDATGQPAGSLFQITANSEADAWAQCKTLAHSAKAGLVGTRTWKVTLIP